MKISKNKRAVERRKRALLRLEIQLKAGTKIVREENLLAEVPLQEKDVKRINKEIETIKSRV